MRILSLFSGIGAFEKALEKLDIDYELVNYCEFDKYASKAYSLIHGVPESMNLGDITKVKLEDLKPYSADLITYGFPCQDISTAGKQRGFEYNGELTRSGLFFNAADIIGKVKPKVAICENVKALTSKKFKKEFETVLEMLKNMGYTNYWQVLNAKNYGIPQNRERVFIVSIRNDIDKEYKFPEPIELKLKLKDMLEDEVDEKYYLSEEKMNYFVANTKKQKEKTIMTRAGDRMDDNFIDMIGSLGIKGYEQTRKVYGADGISPTLIASNKQPKILIKNATKKGYLEAKDGDYVNLQFPGSNTKRGRVIKECSGTLMCNDGSGVVVENPFCKTERNQSDQMLIDDKIAGFEQGECLRIRKLTPKERFRLMGFDDSDVDILVKNKISNTQLYKMAGNSIVVNVLMGIFDGLRDVLSD